MEFYSAEVPEYYPIKDDSSLGFSSSINRLAEHSLNLNDFLVPNPNATFFMKVKGESMKEYRIHDGDILIIDRSSVIKSGMIVLGILNSEYVVKKILFDKNVNPIQIRLISDDGHSEIRVAKQDTFEIWGQILYTIHKHE